MRDMYAAVNRRTDGITTAVPTPMRTQTVRVVYLGTAHLNTQVPGWHFPECQFNLRKGANPQSAN